MPKPQHTLTRFSGVRGAPTAPMEQWSFGLSWDGRLDASTGPAMTTTAETLRTVWATHLKPIMQGDCSLTRVEVVTIQPDGSYNRRDDGSYERGLWNGVDTPSNGSNYLPLQCSLVVSLTSARAGATGRGRFFLPHPVATPDPGDKRLSVANTQAVVTAVKGFLDATRAAMAGGPTDLDLAIVSSKGYATPVTGFRIGRRTDILRSRAADVLEGYVEGTLAT